jgi:hypothetical protein
VTRPAQQTALPETTLAANALLEVPQEARAFLWRGLMEAAEGALDLWEQTPPRHRGAVPSFPVRHAGQQRFNPDDLRCQTLEGWHRLTGLEVQLAVEALEALIQTDEARYRALLAEQCARVGQLYSELKRRAGVGVALALLRGELHKLRYRASPVLASLTYDETSRPPSGTTHQQRMR